MAAFRHLPVLAKQAWPRLARRAGCISTAPWAARPCALLLEASSPDGRLLGIDRDEALAAAGGLRPMAAAFALCRAISPLCAAWRRKRALTRRTASCWISASLRINWIRRSAAFPICRMRRRHAHGQSAGLTAADLLNTLSKRSLHILYTYGERWAARIAKFIAAARKAAFATTGQLAAVIKQAMPAAAREGSASDKRSFQALRIAVNGELEALEQV